MLDLLQERGYSPLVIRNRPLLPIVQGGMGVGISAHRLASAVARTGAMGTVASVDLRHHHPDLLAIGKGCRDADKLDALNLTALDREVRMALEQSNGSGAIAVNVMKAVDQHPQLVRQACESGAHAIVMGAGLPLDLPELTADFPDVWLIPILSDARGVTLLLRKWMRKNRLPDAIVIEHPAHAGGHLGATRIDELNDGRFEFDVVIAQVQQSMRELGLDPQTIPLIAAGGINNDVKVATMYGLGYQAVQLGTAFAVTEEGDAHPNFKRVLAGAGPRDIVEFTSVAGLPARAVMTQWLKRYLAREPLLKIKATAGKPRKCTAALECLTVCGLRDSIARFGQFCIDTQLAAALRGDLAQGLFFRGASSVPFGERIRSVRELIEFLLTGRRPGDVPAAEDWSAIRPASGAAA